MLKTYDKPLLKRVGSLEKFTAATESIPSYCYDYLVSTEAVVDPPDECKELF